MSKKQKILDIHVYIRGRFLFEGQPNDTVPLGHHSRITKHYERMNTADIVQSEIKERKGRTLISCEYILTYKCQY